MEMKMAKKPAAFPIKGKTYQSDTGGTVKIGKTAAPPMASKGVMRKGKRKS
jgi:hypothetical protein